jgi:hypothetical protein
VYPPSDPVEQKRLKRAMRRHERDHERLQRVMDVEGSEFSEEKWEQYKNQKAGGIVFIAIGGAGLIATIIYGLKVIVEDATDSWCTDSDYDDSYDGSTSSTCDDHDGRLGHPAQRVALWTMFISGSLGSRSAGAAHHRPQGKRGAPMLEGRHIPRAVRPPPDRSLFADPRAAAAAVEFQPKRGNVSCQLL